MTFEAIAVAVEIPLPEIEAAISKVRRGLFPRGEGGQSGQWEAKTSSGRDTPRRRKRAGRAVSGDFRGGAITGRKYCENRGRQIQK